MKFVKGAIQIALMAALIPVFIFMIGFDWLFNDPEHEKARERG
jgi:hypothetical protein